MMQQRLPAPAITLTAIGSGRSLTLNAIGATALLICFAQETQGGIEAIETAARERFPDASQLLVGHVVDLGKVARLFHKVAESMMLNEHKKAVAELPEGQDPEDYVLILPDWDGSAVKALGLDDVRERLGVVVIDVAGRIAGAYQGDDPVAATRELLEKV